MSNQIKTYFLAPNFHLIPPPKGPLALGSIITSPSTPERILNKTTLVPVPNPSIYTIHQTKWSSTRSALKEAKVGVWTSFLQVILGITADVDVNRSHDVSGVYKCDDLETTYFQPDDEFIAASLKSTAVKSYMEKTWWGKPVYLVTGLKIARGVSADSEEKMNYGSAVKVGIDATVVLVGVPVSGGPKVEGKLERKEGVSWEGNEDFVFAYRLLRVKLRGKDGEFKEEDYNKGALYNDGDGEEVEEEDVGAERLREAWDINEANGVEEGAEDVAVVCVAHDDLE
ncbi:uncharacterized protein PAC_10212 [Phialocephala subalpina]|uniref:Uncharacterized protein n=1 Tax=Phialocephala subalpina TaxID=576137 RepID=A0A1L7X5K9_9HELO|nr:uncharacterized protein PAC_10212 [Phialocephala subalpina]